MNVMVRYKVQGFLEIKVSEEMCLFLVYVCIGKFFVYIWCIVVDQSGFFC